MEELIKQVSEKSGISLDQAKSAVESVKAYLSKNLPESLQAPLTGALNGQKIPDGFTDKLDDFKDAASGKLKDLGDSAKGMMDKLF